MSERPKILITGYGFAARTHINTILEREDRPYGVVVVGRDEHKLSSLKQKFPGVQPEQVDLAYQPQQLAEVLAKHLPKYIVHLAAAPAASGAPGETLRNNTQATRNLLEAVSEYSRDTTVIVTTSSAVYGDRAGELSEELPIPSPSSFIGNEYPQSKRIDIDTMNQYRDQGLKIVEARVFNHAGPGQEIGLYTTLIRSAVAMEKEKKLWTPKITPAYMRDVQDVRNWADASLRLVESQTDGTFNICSGQGVTLEDFVTQVADVMGIGLEIIDDNGSPQPLQTWGNNDRLRSTGWEPQISLEQTLRDSVRYRRRHSQG